MQTYRTLRALRWVICALGLTLGVVLVANGATVVGLLIGAIAVLRLVMLTMLTRRRRGRAPARWPR
ncbi:MAG TPA: hypothetical protein VH986_02340 [Acidimicrobiia bacterium]|jgi:hypothetical protein